VCRLQDGGVALASSQSSEEKQMVSVAVTSHQPIVPEVAGHMITLTGLTESSSSSKSMLMGAFDNAPILSFYSFLKTGISLTDTF
jgi:hypothetical protein